MRGEEGFEQKSDSQSCLVTSQWTERRCFQRLCGSPHGWTQVTRVWVRGESGVGRGAHSDRGLLGLSL